MIKYTHFNTDPIITRWVSKRGAVGNDKFNYELTDENIENINKLLINYIP